MGTIREPQCGYSKAEIERLLRRKAWSQARKRALVALKRAPRDLWLLDKVAYTLYCQNKDRDALIALRKCLRFFPGDAKFMSNMALVLWYLDEEEKARKMYLSILRLKPKPASVQRCTRSELRNIQNEARGMLGKIYLVLHRSGTARKWFAEFIRHYKRDSRCAVSIREARKEVWLVDLGDQICQAQNEAKWQRVKWLIDRYLRKESGSFYFMAERGFTCMKLGQYREGLKSVREANKVIKDEPLGLWYEGRILEQLRRPKDALRFYKQILRMSEREIGIVRTGEGVGWARALINDCLFRIGRIYAEQGRYAAATKCIGQHMTMRKRVIWNEFYVRTVRAVLAGMKDRRGAK